MYWRVLPTRLWWFALLLVGGLGAIFYLALGRVAKLSITEQLLHREEILARAEASNITSFFQVFGDSTAVLAKLHSMERRDAVTAKDLDAFVEQWQDRDLIGGVVLTDRHGVVQFNSNILGTHDVGASLADRDYFVWAKSQPGEGEYFVGQSVISRVGVTKGQVIVPVASPVYQNGVFAGVVAASVKLDSLTKHYLELMKVSDQEDVYLTNESGDVLYSSSTPDSVGSNIFELLPGLKNTLNTGQEDSFQTKLHLKAYSPISLGSQNWSLVVVSPIQNVVNLTIPIYIRLAIMLLLVFFSIVLFGAVTSREVQKRS